jgi:hypothetical protein
MSPEIERFGKWQRCRNPQATTHVHCTSDVKLLLAWAGKSPDAIIGRRCWLLSGPGWCQLVPHAPVF